MNLQDIQFELLEKHQQQQQQQQQHPEIPSFLYGESLSLFLHWSLADLHFILALSLLLTVLRYVMQYKIVQLLTNAALAYKFVPDSSKRVKLSESLWKSIYYATTCIWVLGSFTSTSSYNLWNLRLTWFECEKPIPLSVKYYYLTQLAFYLHSIFAHLTIEVRRRDFFQMLVHHLVTVFLICISYGMGYVRPGIVVLFLHDINDVFLESGKILVYSNRFQHITRLLFFGLIACWAITRLILFPATVLYSLFFDTYEIYGEEIINKWFYMFWTFNVSLWIIAALDTFWFFLMIRMLFRVLYSKIHLVDSREESEE